MAVDISTDTLLDEQAICEKISISENDFRKLYKSKKNNDEVGGMLASAISASNFLDSANPLLQGKTPFPEPSCFVGTSPRWTASVINDWLNKD